MNSLSVIGVKWIVEENGIIFLKENYYCHIFNIPTQLLKIESSILFNCSKHLVGF
jgi:hypothetical protein